MMASALRSGAKTTKSSTSGCSMLLLLRDAVLLLQCHPDDRADQALAVPAGERQRLALEAGDELIDVSRHPLPHWHMNQPGARPQAVRAMHVDLKARRPLPK